MEIKQRIHAFFLLGKKLRELIAELEANPNCELAKTMIQAETQNQWFTAEHVKYALSSVSSMLDEKKLIEFGQKYLLDSDHINPKTVAIIMAGNIPLVGFQDFVHVLLSGNKALCKLSSDDAVLLPFVAQLLIEANPEFEKYIEFATGKIEGFDAVIATGSNNTSRYFEYYFSKYPHIIRKNRNSVAVLSGNETAEQLERLADDVFLYFGFGCRNVSALVVPEDYDFEMLIHVFQKYSHFGNHHKYMNNYDYYRAIFMVNSTPFIDGGFFMLMNSDTIHSFPGIIHYHVYKDISEVRDLVNDRREDIQCIVGDSSEIENVIPFGSAQQPLLDDFADGVNTMNFLSELSCK